MMAPSFFALAAQSPTRRRTFRWAVVVNLLVVAAGAWLVVLQGPRRSPALVGHLLLIAGIIEGAALVGWRLSQMPKSQALEFLLVSPLRPRWLFINEALVGLTQLALVTLAGLPVMALLVAEGFLDPLDPVLFVVMPFTWGAVVGLGLTMWAYEAQRVRRWGERGTVMLVVLYLAVGVLAGENLRAWLDALPFGLGAVGLQTFRAVHIYNPFGMMQYWMDWGAEAAWAKAAWLEVGAALAAALMLVRGAWRLQAHFHELHYQPIALQAGEARPAVGDRPLSWWAVKRVTRYSGRINLWLAGGFGLLYALYTAAGTNWPAWMGKSVFQIFDQMGGVAGLTTGLVVLAATPAAFQYGLWDSNAHNRCRRLELLLLSRLDARDYWNAAAAAAWKRGRGYFAVALLLWAAALYAGQAAVGQVVAAAAAGVLLWGLYFAFGFRAFARGVHANGLGLLLTVGLPLAAFALNRLGQPALAALTPPGAVYGAAVGPWWVIGPVLIAGLALWTARRAQARCDRDLRDWYDRSHGAKVMA
jgi:hypothetical protein